MGTLTGIGTATANQFLAPSGVLAKYGQGLASAPDAFGKITSKMSSAIATGTAAATAAAKAKAAQAAAAAKAKAATQAQATPARGFTNQDIADKKKALELLAQQQALTTGAQDQANMMKAREALRQDEIAAAEAAAADQPASASWTLEGDPTYNAAMDAGRAEFNYAQAQSLADLQNSETQLAGQRKALDVNAAEARRRLAGNYAARGMAGGAAGALSLAEARANAEQVAAQTSLKDQLAALNKNYLATYGAPGTDWTGTLLGQKYKTAAAQSAIQAQMARMGL
jgi:hypothetical protein